MRGPKLGARTLLAGALGGTLALGAGSASAHSLLTAPLPRDGSDSHKDPNGPCGVSRLESQPVTPLPAGSQLTVTWNETVNHPGCFVVDFATASDLGWQTLATLPHNGAGTTPRPYTAMVTLPDTACSDCTLRVRQIMLDAELAPGDACPPPNLASGLTYYSCANLRLGDGSSAGGDTSSSSAGTTSGGGGATSGAAATSGAGGATSNGAGTTSGGSMTDAAASDGGCVMVGGAGKKPLAPAALGFAFAIWLRRFSRRRSRFTGCGGSQSQKNPSGEIVPVSNAGTAGV